MEIEFWSDYYDRIFNSWKKFGESINKKASDTNDKAKVMLSGYSNWSDEQLKEFIDRDIFIIYSDINGNYCEATINSSFSRDMDSVQATGKYGATLFTAPTSYTYKIDDNCVDYDTLIKVMFLLKKINNIKKKDKHSDTIRGKRANSIYRDESFIACTKEYKDFMTLLGENYLKKENEDMPKIVNYKYNEEKGLTEITWSDKTITRVVAGDNTEKSAYVGFVSACAKKLFGNKSTYLNQFDKWAVKKPEQERKKAEAEKAKAKEQAKIEAKRAERAKEKEAERLAKLWAKQYKRENERIKIAEAAEKIAKDKYGIPDDWFGSDCCCECSDKEFDNLNTEDITDEDISD